MPSYATAVLYRLDLSTGRCIDVYRNFEVGPRNPFVAALQDGGVMVLRGHDENRVLREDPDYSLLTFHNEVALDVLRCGGYDFYAAFAHRITEQPETLWNPDARGDVKMFRSTPYSETWRSDEFQIPGRQFRIRHVSPASLTLVRLYHNFNCEQYVNQILYRGKTYQTKNRIRMIHKLPTSHYLFAGDDFLLLFEDGIMKGTVSTNPL